MLARWSPLTFDVSTLVFSLYPITPPPLTARPIYLFIFIFPNKQVFSPRTPRQKTPLVQRWESGLINGHNEDDDWRRNWKKKGRRRWMETLDLIRNKVGEGDCSTCWEHSVDLLFSWKSSQTDEWEIIIRRRKQNVFNQHKGKWKRKLQDLKENHFCLIDWQTITTSLAKYCNGWLGNKSHLTFVDFYRLCFHDHWLSVVVL